MLVLSTLSRDADEAAAAPQRPTERATPTETAEKKEVSQVARLMVELTLSNQVARPTDRDRRLLLVELVLRRVLTAQPATGAKAEHP